MLLRKNPTITELVDKNALKSTDKYILGDENNFQMAVAIDTLAGFKTDQTIFKVIARKVNG